MEDLKIDDNLLRLENGKIIKSPIKSIEEIPLEPVYDFTTIHNNHSFVANTFITHNCIETPEGQKIGIVKSLSMTSTITTQNISQEKVIKSILNSTKINHPADVDPLEMNRLIKIFINGDWFAVCEMKHSLEIYNLLKEKRRENIIDKYVSMYFDFERKEIKIYYDGGRLIRPLLIVNDNELNLTEEVVKYIDDEMKKSNLNKSWKKLPYLSY